MRDRGAADDFQVSALFLRLAFQRQVVMHEDEFLRTPGEIREAIV